MPKSISQQKKETASHVGALKQAAGRIGTSQDMYTLYANKLKAVKDAAGMKEWYYAFSKRVNAQISQDHSEAMFMRSQLESIRSITGLQR